MPRSRTRVAQLDPCTRWPLLALSVIVLWTMTARGAAAQDGERDPAGSADPSESYEQTTTPTSPPGNAKPDKRFLAGRHRLEISAGYWDPGGQAVWSLGPLGAVSTQVENLALAFSYSYWTQEQVAAQISLKALVADVLSTTGPSGYSDEAVVISSALVGLRYYPFSAPRAPIHPYLTASIGPYLGVESEKRAEFLQVAKTTTILGSVGGYLGGGLDLLMGRHFMVGIHVGYNLMADFREDLAGRRNYGGVEYGAGISVVI